MPQSNRGNILAALARWYVMRRTAICWLAVVLFALLGFCQTTTPKQTTGSIFPVVVAKVARWHQTGSIPATTLFTPKHFGVYRASGLIVTTVAGSAGNLVGYITWKDGAGAQMLYWNGQTNVGDISTSSPPFRDLDGTPIQYSTSLTDGTGIEYNLFIVIEQIM